VSARRLAAEFAGTAFLLATVVGSGIMAERLSGGSVGLALLANSLATGAMLVVLILAFAQFSGAHFNPAVTLVTTLRREMRPADSLAYMLAQVAGAIAGVWLTHGMFDEAVIQFSTKTRAGGGQWLAEGVATFGLVMTILLVRKAGTAGVAACVGLYIGAAYWFTASTSFANPAVTFARALSDTFAGIRPADAPAFIVAQFAGAALASPFAGWLLAAGEKPLPQA